MITTFFRLIIANKLGLIWCPRRPVMQIGVEKSGKIEYRLKHPKKILQGIQHVTDLLYSRLKKTIYFNINYRTEIKPVLLQFDALKFFLEVHLHGGSPLNFNFFNVNP